MKNSQNITIVLLMVTAAMLAAMVIGTYKTQTAYAEPTARMGDYILATGAIAQASDGLYVINVPTNRLNIYVPNSRTNVIELTETVNLERIFSRGAGGGTN